MDQLKQVMNRKTGPGGWKCPCCGPKPDERKAARRAARHRLKNATRREVSELLSKED